MFSNDPQFEMDMVSQTGIFRGEPTPQARGVTLCFLTFRSSYFVNTLSPVKMVYHPPPKKYTRHLLEIFPKRFFFAKISIVTLTFYALA